MDEVQSEAIRPIKTFEDYFGTDASELKKKRLFLFDMDGTIYAENRLFDGTLELLKVIENRGGKYVFITNNSSRSVIDYVKKVRKFGIKADGNNFFTSVQATILYLWRIYPDQIVYCQGTGSFVKELRAAGIEVVTEYSEEAGVVVVGFDTELSTEKLYTTCRMLQRKIPFIATNPDLRCPVSFGYVPDCGSICGMLEAATGRKPVYIGKPEPVMVESVCQKLGYGLEDTVVIGDRLYTDIAAGWNAGVTTICVLTGEATVESIMEGDRKPSFTFKSVKEICQVL